MQQVLEVERSNRVELVTPHIITVHGMQADVARNRIARQFLDSEADWLMWIDADNTLPAGAVETLLDGGRKLTSGLYVNRLQDSVPVSYIHDGRGYRSMSLWRRGEIVRQDAAGMGCVLVHRSVFEDIENAYRVFEGANGRLRAIHKDDLQGAVLDTAEADTDGKLVDGVFHERLRQARGDYNFPFFVLEAGRTEDMHFFELAKRVGHNLWVDTSVEVGHQRTHMNMPSEYLERVGHGG